MELKMKLDMSKTDKPYKLCLSLIIIISCTWFAAAVSLFSDSINSIALYCALPIAFLITFIKSSWVRNNRYLSLLVCLYCWILCSVCWADNIELALRQIKQILGTSLLCYIIAANGQKTKNLPWLYFTFIILLIGDWYYAYNNIFDVIDLGVDRLDDEKLNANSLAYHTFYVTMAIYVLGILDNFRFRKIFRWLFLLTIPLSFQTALLTASRQVLLIQVPFIFALLVVRYYTKISIAKRLLFIICLVVACATLGHKVYSEYENSTLHQRAEKDLKEDSRTKLMKDAFKVGLEHQPFGVGAGNYIVYSYNKHFSHNNYLELFANEGIIGLWIYLWMMFHFMKVQIRRYKKFKDKYFLVFAFFGIFYIIDGFFYVFYAQIWLISFFILVATHSDTYYKTKMLEYGNKRNRNTY